jgi:hypothetical protein
MFGVRLNVGHKCSIPLKQSDTIRIHQCESVGFWASHTRILAIICTDPDPDMDPGPSINKQKK